MNVRDLQERRAVLVTEMRSITSAPAGNAGDLSADQATKFDQLKAELEATEKNIGRQKLLDESERRMKGENIVTSGDDRLDDAMRDFSLRRAICMQIPDLAQQVDTGRERELSNEVARRSGRAFQGIAVPLSVFHRRLEKRTITTELSSPDAGGSNLTFTDHRGDQFIDELLARMVVQRLGARVLSNLTGAQVDLPKLSSASSSSWIAEDSALSAGDPVFSKVQLTPKTVGCMSEYSRNLLIQSDPSIEQILRNDFAQVLARAVDAGALNGTGGTQPTGLLNVGIDETTQMGTTPSWADVLTLIELVEDANSEGSGWATNPSVVRLLRSTLRAASTDSVMLMQEPNNLAGYPLQSTTAIPATLGSPGADSALIFGNWADLIIGYWSGVDILVNPYETSAYARGNTKIRGLLTCDVAVRHVQSFAASVDITA